MRLAAVRALRPVLLPLLLALVPGGAAAQSRPAPPTPAGAAVADEGLVGELEALARVERLPRYRPRSQVAQVSSYDTTGGNNDGFSGQYSYIRREPGGLVLLDAKGPGVLHRVWTPTPTDDTLSFYFDGEREPRLRLRFSDLFSGTVYPFVRPVVGNEVGGFYSYVPMPFARSLKVVFSGDTIRFHQLQYRRYADGRAVRSFPRTWAQPEREALARAVARWSAEPAAAVAAVRAGAAVRTDSVAAPLAPGDTLELFRATRGGRVVGLTLGPAAAFAGLHRDVLLEAYWDGDRRPAIRAPVADFFGFAYGRPAMRGLLAGTTGDTSYTVLPMPFDSAATVRLVYRRRGGAAQPTLRVAARVAHSAERRDAATEGRLYAAWRREVGVPLGTPYLLLSARGRGHHVGTVLLAQGLEPGMTGFFEGDDRTEIDGALRLHGTGSEDYFNGGWYAMVDRWDQGRSLPLHGALAYSLPMSRTGGYRFYLADKPSFERSFRLTIEHGAERNEAPVDYGSVALYYGESPPLDTTEPSDATTAVTVPRAHVFYPQLLPLTVGWKSEARFLENNRDLQLRSPGGVETAVVRLTLDEVPNGRYRLLLSYSEVPTGGEFSVWQRQRQVAPWRSSAAPVERRLVRRPLGEIELTDQLRTVSFQTRGPAGRNELRFDEVMLERLP